MGYWEASIKLTIFWFLHISERLEKEAEEEEKRRLEEMSEDEYDALTEEERAEIDQKRLKAKKERLMKK